MYTCTWSVHFYSVLEVYRAVASGPVTVLATGLVYSSHVCTVY